MTDASSTPQQVAGRAIQDLTAARLGRGFLPLGLLTLAGLAQIVVQGAAAAGGWVLLLGGPAAAGAMLAYGLRGVQKAFGRPHRRWMGLAAAGGLVPLVFGLYVLGWRGLRTMAQGGSTALLVGGALTGLGAWALMGWVRVMEVQRLADTMSGIGDLEGE